jgi:hypothetical protein
MVTLKNIIPWALAIIIAILLMRSCSVEQQLSNEINLYRDSTFLTKNRLHKADSINGKAVYEMQQLKGSEQEARLIAGQYADKLKHVSAVVNVGVSASVKNLHVPFDDIPRLPSYTNAAVDTGANVPSYASLDTSKQYPTDTTQLTVPRSVTYNSEWFYISERIRYNGVTYDSIGFNPGKLTFVFGEKKQGFLGWGKPVPVVNVIPENPHFAITYGNNVVVDNRKKPKRLLWAAGGGIAATIIILATSFLVH